MNHFTFVLPGGYIDDGGVLHREVDLAPLTGREEEMAADSKGTVTAILSRCLRRLGTISPVPDELVRRLLVADRQYLLLKLRDITFGDRIQATVCCPWANCGKKVDIDFSLRDIPVTESKEKGPTYTMELSMEAACSNEHGQAERAVAFRLPNGEDQEVLSSLEADAESVIKALLLRCIQRVGYREDPGDAWIGRLSPLALQEIERHMEAVAPRVELTLGARCRECGGDFEVPFDPQEFFLGELRATREVLHHEVHCLAYHYHWSEQEIMAMTRNRRQRYIEVLVDELGRINHGN